MINRYRVWQRIAAVLLSCSSTTVWGQLPATQKPSPLNQLGRSLGFGISDGYHECPECNRPSNFSKAMDGSATVSHVNPCLGCEKQSFVSRMNPFKESNHSGQGPSSGFRGNGTNAMPMTVLPPSPQMYQQFAAPSETALPGSNIQPTNPTYPNTFQNQANPEAAINGVPGLFPQENFPPGSGSQVPDPVEMNSPESDLPSNEPVPGQDVVPPPPVLRKRQKGDKPLGEPPSPALPRERVPADPFDKSDDSLDLLPKEGSPPITIGPKASQGRSLISHVKTIPDERVSSSMQVPSDSMLRKYYGKAYLSREITNENTSKLPREVQRQEEFSTPSVNRYRYR